MTMKQIELSNDNVRDVVFTGEKIAGASSREHQGARSSRWQVLQLYRTETGRLVCYRESVTCWQGESDTHEVCVCESHGDVMEFFGFCDLAKEIYEEADINAAQEVA